MIVGTVTYASYRTRPKVVSIIIQRNIHIIKRTVRAYFQTYNIAIGLIINPVGRQEIELARLACRIKCQPLNPMLGIVRKEITTLIFLREQISPVYETADN